MHPMSLIYADLIRDGLKTIDQVPEKNRAEVQALIDANADD